jgi:hypothetical protein
MLGMVVCMFCMVAGTARMVAKATAARSDAITRQKQVTARNKPLMVALDNTVRASFGTDHTVLGAFGLDPPKTGAKTAEVKREAAAKAKATREARGTKGAKQKKSVKG